MVFNQNLRSLLQRVQNTEPLQRKHVSTQTWVIAEAYRGEWRFSFLLCSSKDSKLFVSVLNIFGNSKALKKMQQNAIFSDLDVRTNVLSSEQ